MKILHSADLHLDSPFTGRTPEQAQYLKEELRKIPGKLAELCAKEQCQMLLLSGDLFDGEWTMQSLDALRHGLEECAVPVFISPGNHDYVNHKSPYTTQSWPSNVHIFKNPAIESVYLKELDCRVYGAGYRSMDCPALLKGFHKKRDARYHIGVLHGDPKTADSPCCPITPGQLEASGLDYLALGHLHKGGSVRKGHTLCAWPGSPMGRGFDETGAKGALVVTLEKSAQVQFVRLDTPRFYEKESTVQALSQNLPAETTRNFYRVDLVGEGTAPALEQLYRQYDHLPNLELRDRRQAPAPLWETAGTDTLEGIYFHILKEALEAADDQNKATVELAARISRNILTGQEVVLP